MTRRQATAPAAATQRDPNVYAIRSRFSALQRSTAFLDGPAGTQCPDSVIDAIAHYLRSDNANLGGPFPTSRRSDELVAEAHEAAGRFLGCSPDHVAFGQSSTAMNFLLTRALARDLGPGDQVLVTKLDHDANVSPWLHLADDIGIEVRLIDLNDDLSLDLRDLATKRTDRTRVVAFTAAANSVGTKVDVRAVADLAHEVGALAWVDAVHLAPHEPLDAVGWDVDVLLCSAYKFFGPHLGVAYVASDLSARLRPYQVRPAPDTPPGHRYELGTAQHELLAGFVASVNYVDSVGSDWIRQHERLLGECFLAGIPDGVVLYGPPVMTDRVSTFAFNLPGRSAQDISRHLAEHHDIAVWWGDNYAIETIRHLGVDPADGTIRAGFVHYNTLDEVDRLLTSLRELT